MAYWQRRSGKVRVLSYDPKTKKTAALPRVQSEHLDDLPDTDLDDWVRRWSGLKLVTSKNPKQTPVREPNILAQLERYLAYLEQNEGKHPTTRDGHRRFLADYALPYFVNRCECLTVAEFSKHSKGLTDWLSKEVKTSPKQIKRVNQSLAKFWRWAVEESLGSGELVLRRLPVERRQTPLQFTLKPSEVIGWSTRRADVHLFGLIAYFFSLRPQEVMALEKRDFATGSKALSFECSKAMVNSGLDGCLVVNIVKQNSKVVGITEPKSSSRGVVACFSSEARIIIQRALDQREPGRLFPLSIDHYYHLWARWGIPGITLKDLRRASIYWLAHYSSLSLPALRNHARHSSIETTGLYTRRPEENF
jgi:integrase